jgi:hypothetical protein
MRCPPTGVFLKPRGNNAQLSLVPRVFVSWVFMRHKAEHGSVGSAC